MPHFLITGSIPIIDIRSGFEGQGNPAVVVECPNASQIGEKLRGEKPRRKRKIGDTNVEGRVWALKLRSDTLVPLTAQTPGLDGYYEDLVYDEEDLSQYWVCLVGGTAFAFAPDEERILYITEIPFVNLSG